MRIIVINLERATERRKKMQERFSEIGLEFEFQKALDWREVTEQHRSLVDYDTVRRKSSRMRDGQLACWLSHRQIFLDLIDNGPEMVAVFEDDVEFSPQLPDILNRIEGLQHPFDIIFLHRRPKHRPFLRYCSLGPRHRLGWIVFSPFGTQGYVITRNAARRFLAWSMPICHPIGRALARYWHHGLITYCLDPAVLYHCHEGDSFITEAESHAPGVRRDLLYHLRRRWRHITESVLQKLAFAYLVTKAYSKRLWTHWSSKETL